MPEYNTGMRLARMARPIPCGYSLGDTPSGLNLEIPIRRSVSRRKFIGVDSLLKRERLSPQIGPTDPAETGKYVGLSVTADLILSDAEGPGDYLPLDGYHHLVVSAHHHITYIPWTEGHHVGSTDMTYAVIQDAVTAF